MRTIGISGVLTLAVCATVLAGILGLLAYVSATTTDTAERLAEQSMRQSAEAVSRTLDLYAGQASELAAALSLRSGIREAFDGNPAVAQSVLVETLASFKGVRSVVVFDAAGGLLAGRDAGGKVFEAGASYADRPYVQALQSGASAFLTKATLAAKNGGSRIMVAANAVRAKDGKLLGGVAVCCDVGPAVTALIAPLRFGEKGYGFVLDEAGVVAAHAGDPTMAGRDVTGLDFIRRLMEVKHGVFDYAWKDEAKTMAVVQSPATGWYVGMTASKADLAASAASQRNMLLALGLAVVALITAVIAVLARRLVLRPLAAINAFADRVADGDFGAKLDGTFRYELAALAGHVRHMVDELKTRLGFAKGLLDAMPLACVVSAPDGSLRFLNQPVLDFLKAPGRPEDYLGQMAGEFFYGDPDRQTITARAIAEGRAITGVQADVPARDGSAAFTQIDAAPLFDLDGVCLGGVALFSDLTQLRRQQLQIEAQNGLIGRTASEAASVADRMASAAEQLSAQIEQCSQGATEQSDRVQGTAAAVEQMNATILEVAKNAGNTARSAGEAQEMARRGAKLADDVVGAVNAVRQQAASLKDTMSGLGQRAQGIGAVMNVISDIADQTNLLALNAAIEAARAGEAGRGFAVVADEVRKLAEKTMTATREVGQAIAGIQQGTAETVAMVDEAVASVEEATSLARRSGEALTDIVTKVSSAGDQVQAIAAAAEEQSSTVEEISRAVAAINRIAGETADAMIQSATAVTDLADQAQGLSILVADMQSGESRPALGA